MKYEKIFLKDLNEKAGDSSFFEVYKAKEFTEISNCPHPALIVLPGGAYQFCSEREAEPVALRFCSEGFVVFVLNYTCNVAYPIPHYELTILFDYVYKHADEYKINKDMISVMGFSAGGHLAASYSLLYKELANELSLCADSLKPYANILCYPVTSTILDTNSSTKDVISGGNEDLLKKLSVLENLDNDYPPTFIWTTKIDDCVPTEHSIQMFENLKKNKVKCQLEVYENGNHGGSLFNRGVYWNDYDFDSVSENRNWVEKAIKFIFTV